MLSTEAYGSALPAGSGRMKEGDGLHRPEAWKETVAALEARECPREPESTRRGPESARGDGGARVPERRGGNACPRNLRVASTPLPAPLGQHSWPGGWLRAGGGPDAAADAVCGAAPHLARLRRGDGRRAGRRAAGGTRPGHVRGTASIGGGLARAAGGGCARHCGERASGAVPAGAADCARGGPHLPHHVRRL